MMPSTSLPTFADQATPDWPLSLISVLERQQALVDQLSALSSTQANLIADRRTDRLLELLSQRQIVIDEFTVCQARMSALSADLDRRLAGVPAAQRERIRSLIGGIGERLREVMRRDHQDQASLNGGRDAVMAELASMDTARTARAAYGPAAPAINRFADRRA